MIMPLRTRAGPSRPSNREQFREARTVDMVDLGEEKQMEIAAPAAIQLTQRSGSKINIQVDDYDICAGDFKFTPKPRPDPNAPKRPPPMKRRVKIYVQILTFGKIDSTEQTFKAYFYLKAAWIEPDLMPKEGNAGKINELEEKVRKELPFLGLLARTREGYSVLNCTFCAWFRSANCFSPLFQDCGYRRA